MLDESIELIAHLYQIENKSSECIAKCLRIFCIKFIVWKYYNLLQKLKSNNKIE